MKYIKRLGLIFSCIVLASVLHAFPENIELGGKETRGSVLFPHEFHMSDFQCIDCHHEFDEKGENVLDEFTLQEGNPDILCGKCHNPKEKIERMEAFHYQCIGCHDRFKMTNTVTGPTMCGECHILQKEK